MSKLTGREPAHWHDKFGLHPKDPRIPAVNGVLDKRYWSQDDWELAAHLDAHEAAFDDPARQKDDPAVISALFDVIEANEGQNTKMRALIRAYRMERQ